MSDDFKFKKMYGWKEDLRYHLLLPKWFFRSIIGVIKGDHKLNDMTIRAYLSLACACCDMEAGRYYILEEKGDEYESSFEDLLNAFKDLEEILNDSLAEEWEKLQNTEEWFERIEKLVEGFKKQERQKQELDEYFTEQIVRNLKVDFDDARKKNPNFCDGFVEGFREDYLQRGKEILEERRT